MTQSFDSFQKKWSWLNIAVFCILLILAIQLLNILLFGIYVAEAMRNEEGLSGGIGPWAWAFVGSFVTFQKTKKFLHAILAFILFLFTVASIPVLSSVLLAFLLRWESGKLKSKEVKEIMGKIIGIPLKVAGIISFIIFGLWGLAVIVGIVNEIAGFLGVVIGFMLFPVMFVAAPWYALVAWGNWLPLVIVYGGGILSSILYGLGSIIDGD